MTRDLLAFVLTIVRTPATNNLVAAAAGLLAAVLAWKIVPLILDTIPALEGERIPARVLKGVLSLGAGVVLGLLCAAAIRMLRAA